VRKNNLIKLKRKSPSL